MNDIIPNDTTEHLFEIGDFVKHATLPDLVGTIAYQLMYGEDFIPLYGVQWNDHFSINHESQDILIKN
jgi:hypothetical protein